MLSAEGARLKGSKRQRVVPPLWQSSLGMVLNNLSEEHTEDFVKMILRDSKMRKRLTTELLRNAKHIPDLGDTDLVEFLALPVHENEDDDGYRAVPMIRTCQVGALPYWLNAALKAQFRNRCGGDAKVSDDLGQGNMTRDGRLEFVLCEDDTATYKGLQDAYINHLFSVIEQEGIPNKEDAGYPDPSDDVDIYDVAPEVQPDTVLYDAWDLSINDAEASICEEFEERVGQLVCLQAMDLRDVPTLWIPAQYAMHQFEIPQSAVWLRKPRVRFVLHPA